MSDHLTVAEVLAIHEDQIERYGGTQGVRDRGLLEAALYRPQTGYYADLIEEDAALWESLAQNHPFIDGNKRTAFAVTYTFLVINGFVSRPVPTRPILSSPVCTARTSLPSRSSFSGCARILRDGALIYERRAVTNSDNIRPATPYA
jgi:death-on-curing family protein